MGSSSGFNKN